MKLIKQEKELIVTELNQDKIVAIPTETVYGLAVKLNSQIAIKKLSDLKNREDKMFTMMIYNKEDISKYANVDSKAQEIIDKYFPGELTLILPVNKDFNSEYFKDTIGIRIPKHELMLDVLKLSGPLLVTSCNYKGEAPLDSSVDIIKKMDIDVIVEGVSGRKKPSTVIKIENREVIVLRQGDLFIK